MVPSMKPSTVENPSIFVSEENSRSSLCLQIGGMGFDDKERRITPKALEFDPSLGF